MAVFRSSRGQWNLPYFHAWSQRTADLQRRNVPLIGRGTRIATIGSCFAEEIARALDYLNLNGQMHPAGRFYHTASIRQEIERIFGEWPQYQSEPLWKVRDGLIHPFKDYHQVFPSESDLRQWSEKIDREAESLFRSADVVLMTVGLIEAWMQPRTNSYYREIPHPDAFDSCGAVFKRLSVSEMIDDLARVREMLKANTQAELMITVSPIPLHVTMTDQDVRVANAESKSRVRAAVSEFVDAFSDVHYFHSYEIVTTAENQSDFMMDDGRHVHRHAVEYIVQQFLAQFAKDDLRVPHVDTSWLTPPKKAAEGLAPTKRFKSSLRPGMGHQVKRFVRRQIASMKKRVQSPGE